MTDSYTINSKEAFGIQTDDDIDRIMNSYSDEDFILKPNGTIDREDVIGEICPTWPFIPIFHPFNFFVLFSKFSSQKMKDSDKIKNVFKKFIIFTLYSLCKYTLILGI